jgi:uncharacterized protein (TIGR00369 family)
MVRDGFTRLRLPPSGFIDANGPLYGRWEGDRVVIGLEIEARHCNSNGTCHGGMLTMLADMLLAMGSSLQGGLSRFLPTVSLTCDFLGPAQRGAWVEGRLDVLKVTKSFVFAQGLLTVQAEPILRANAVLKLPTAADPKYASEIFLPRS